MKNSNIKYFSIMFVSMIACLTWFAPPLSAQIGPLTNSLGIYGSAPTPAGTPFTCGTPTKANLQDYPEVEGGTNITLPLNGYKNFNFFYSENGTGFISGGGYRISYLNSSGTNCYGSGDIVTYSPNSGHTNGVQVRPHNGNLPFRGEHGIVRGVYAGSLTSVPLENALVQVFSIHQQNPGVSVIARTNANGYFSIYYTNGSQPQFLPVSPVFFHEHYSFLITGSRNGCTYVWSDDGLNNLWAPYTSDPSSTGYYTSDAEFVVDIPNLTLNCGTDEG